MPRRVTVRVPATTANLGPGFDCLGMALQLYNTVELQRLDEPALSISIDGPCSSDTIPLDHHNLVYRAADTVFSRTGQRPAGLGIHLTLNAPLARGLGSSASAITGGIVGANAILGGPLPEEAVLELMLGMEGHPDNIVPCLVGGLTASVVVEGRVNYIKKVPANDVDCVLLIPDYELSTSKARQAIPKSVPLKDAVFNLSRVPFVLDRLSSGELNGLADIMDDALHQPYRKSLIKAYDAVSEQAMSAGAGAVCISGAGPTILAIAKEDVSSEVARKMATALESIGVGAQALIVKPELEGTRVSVYD